MLAQRLVEERAARHDLPTEKECRDCHQIKPLSEFNNSMSWKDGLHSHCKPCVTQQSQELKQRWKEDRKHVDPPKEKLCTRCYRIFPIAHFCSNISSKDGFDNICRGCLKKRQKDYSARWIQDRKKTTPKTKKTCAGCKKTLPTSTFYSHESVKDGLNNYCIECSKRMRREYTGRWEQLRASHTKTPTTKICNLCHRTLPIKNFYPFRQYKDGYSATCIRCEKRRTLKYIQRWEEKGIIIPKEKQCQGCKQILPADYFRRNKRKRNGLDYLCKDCSKILREQYNQRWSEVRESKNKDEFTLFPAFEKTCSICHQTKHFTMFFKHRNSKDGYSSSCKDCDLKRQKTYIEKQKGLPKTTPENKVCSACKRLLSASEFNKSRERKDGLYIHCRECQNKKRKEYISKPDVQIRMKEWKRKYHRKPEVRRKERKRQREYSQRDYVKAKRVTYSKKYRARPEVKKHKQQYGKDYYKRKKMKDVNG